MNAVNASSTPALEGTLGEILKACEAAFSVPASDICSLRVRKTIVEARGCAALLVRRLLGLMFCGVGKALGGHPHGVSRELIQVGTALEQLQDSRFMQARGVLEERYPRVKPPVKTNLVTTK